MSHVESHTAKIKAIPRERMRKKVANTVIGVLSVALGVALPVIVPAYPIGAGGLLILFGGYSISQDLVRSFFGFLPAVVRDLYAARKGKE